jgi:hypothetical protein
MPIWRNAGGNILLAGSVPALVRAWTYNPRISNCIYGPIVIIGCDPPACVNYKNTNVNANWFEFVRGTCGAWSGSGGYAWPDDVPDCPYPDGVSIESMTCTAGGVVYLCVAIEATGPFSENVGCHYAGGQYPQYTQGNIGRGPWGIYCYDAQQSLPTTLSIDCVGNVSYYSGYGYTGYRGTGTPIALDAEDLPIGSSVIPVYCEGLNACSYAHGELLPSGYLGTLTITVSKC